MARKKLEKNPDLSKAQVRLSALQSIDVNLDLGSGLTVPLYAAEITKMQQIIGNYNTALSSLDDLYNQHKTQEKLIKDWNERILMGVATKYGKNSSQYEMAGGTRKTERKKIVRKPKAVVM